MQITISIVTVNTVIENVISDISIICINVNSSNIVSLSLKCRILFQDYFQRSHEAIITSLLRQNDVAWMQ